MRNCGIDIGSRTIKIAIVEDKKIVHTDMKLNSFEPQKVFKELLHNLEYDQITATGYGRKLFSSLYNCKEISEIKAFSLGAAFVNPKVHTILDIGGQDIKAIALDNNGKLARFEMNDKCAAGTGKFMEIMAMSLGVSIKELSALALKSTKNIKINSMCAVFAESEVISLLAKGESSADIALGLHQSIADKCVNMIRRVKPKDSVMFAGGVASNSCLKDIISDKLKMDLYVSEYNQLIGAIGSAIS